MLCGSFLFQEHPETSEFYYLSLTNFVFFLSYKETFYIQGKNILMQRGSLTEQNSHAKCIDGVAEQKFTISQY